MKPVIILVTAIALAACAEKEAAPSAGKALSCAAHDGGGASVENAWVREQPDAGAVTAAYFSLCNAGMEPATLTGLTTPIAGMAEMHETRRDENGVVSMAPTDAVTLAPGELVVFEPGGRHVMLTGLAGPVASGDHAPLTFHFADGTSLDVDAAAKSAIEAAAQRDHEEH